MLCLLTIKWSMIKSVPSSKPTDWGSKKPMSPNRDQWMGQFIDHWSNRISEQTSKPIIGQLLLLWKWNKANSSAPAGDCKIQPPEPSRTVVPYFSLLHSFLHVDSMSFHIYANFYNPDHFFLGSGRAIPTGIGIPNERYREQIIWSVNWPADSHILHCQ